MELCLSKDLSFCSLFYLGYFCIAPWNSLSGLCALWGSLSSFPSLWLGRCTLGWAVWPVVGYPLLGVHPSISIVRMIMIGYCCHCLDGQLNYQASAHWLIGVTTMYQLCDQWLCHSTPVSWKEANKRPPCDSVLFRNTSNLYQRWRNYTTSPTHLVGVSCGRHALRWQIWPNRSSSDGPLSSHPVLWKVIFGRRTELGQGMRCHVHAIGSHQLGWQASPTQCQCSKLGGRLAVDSPGHHWMMHWTQRTQTSLLNSAHVTTI